MLLGEAAALHSHIVAQLRGETQAGIKWKRLIIDGKPDTLHAISEQGEIYSFVKQRLLATQDGGKYVRFSTGDGVKLYSVEQLMQQSYPELFGSDSEEWHGIELDGEPTAYEISRSGAVRRKSNRRQVKQSTRNGCNIVWLRHKGQTITASTGRLLAQAFPEQLHED